MALRVTTKWLEKMDACEEQVELFKEAFPRGAAVTLKNLRKADDVGLDLAFMVDRISETLPYASTLMWDAEGDGKVDIDGPEMVMIGIKAMNKKGRKKLG